jgi:hypothetical protein
LAKLSGKKPVPIRLDTGVTKQRAALGEPGVPPDAEDISFFGRTPVTHDSGGPIVGGCLFAEVIERFRSRVRKIKIQTNFGQREQKR